MEKENSYTKIPLIMASDNNYAPQMGVSAISVLQNAPANIFYDFYFLVPPDFSCKFKKIIEKDCAEYKNNKVNFIDMKEHFSNSKILLRHVTQQACYRLLAAQLLPQHEKCLYLDVDAVADSDISAMLDLNPQIENSYVAAIKDMGINNYAKRQNLDYAKLLNIPDMEHYVNSGVLVMNLKKIREDKVTEIFCTDNLKNCPMVDQDVINKVCYDKIALLPPEYNLQTNGINFAQEVFSKEELEIARNSPRVVHYTGSRKPWKYKDVPYREYFWKYAKLSSFYEKIKSDYHFKILNKDFRKKLGKSIKLLFSPNLF